MVLEDGVEIAGMGGPIGNSLGSAYPLDAAEVVDAWRKSKPSMVLSAGETGEVLSMNSFMLQPGEDKIIAEKLSAYLKARSA
jgi:hypothetical protein